MERQSQRVRKLALLAQLQTRAKWYQAIKDKSYRLAIKDEDKGGKELNKIREQNKDLIQAIDQLKDEFPAMNDNLSSIRETIVN